MNMWRFVAESSLPTLFKELPGPRCYVTQPCAGGTDYRTWTATDSPVALRGKRPTSPVKSFFLPPRENVALYWGGEEEPRALSGPYSYNVRELMGHVEQETKLGRDAINAMSHLKAMLQKGGE